MTPPRLTAAALILPLALLFGCAPLPGPALPSAPAPAPIAPAPPSTGDPDLDAALATARTNHTTVFVDFGASWCGWCQRMERGTYADATVKAKLGGLTTCFLDLDQHRALAKKLGVHGIPAYFLVDESGQVLKSGDGYKDPNQFLQWLGSQGRLP